MVALYDYDPRESSPNVDVEVPARRGFTLTRDDRPGVMTEQTMHATPDPRCHLESS
jgi:hypothetical protein